MSRLLVASNLIFSVPAREIPITFAACLNSPVVGESALLNPREGVAALPSCNFIAARSIEESAFATVIPPLKVPNPVNVDVC